MPSRNAPLYSRFISALTLCASIMSCTLVDPIVDVPADCKPPHPVTYSEASDCIKTLVDKYEAGRSQQAILTAGTGLFLFPFSSFITGVAINTGNATKITDFTLGAVGLYGASSWVSSPQRSLIYGEGINVLHCAQTISTPYNVTQEDKESLAKFVETLADRIENAEVALAPVSADILGINTTDPTLNEIQTLLPTIRAALSNAIVLQSDTQALLAKVNALPLDLLVFATTVNGKVNSAIDNASVQLDALPTAIGQFRTLYDNAAASYYAYMPEISNRVATASIGGNEANNQFSTMRTNRQLESGELNRINQNAMNLVRAYTLLKSGYESLKNATENLSERIDSVSFSQCKLDTMTLQASLQTLPAQLSFPAGSIGQKAVEIRGGTGQYVYEGDTQALTASLNGSILMIGIQSDTEAGSYRLIVRDWAQGRSVISVTVTEAQGSETN